MKDRGSFLVSDCVTFKSVRRDRLWIAL